MADEHDVRGLLELAVARHAEGRIDLAIAACERALAIDPRHAAAYGSLVWLLPKLGRSAEVPALFARWAHALPDDPVAVHMHTATSGGVLDRASDAYVAALFDELAPTFDRTLDALGYEAPAAVADALEGRVGTCLDAGCGTGLVGMNVRARVDTLVGVDLSAAMIERARARGIYDALHHAELCEHLVTHEDTYAAIVAADVLVYTGALDPIAVAIAGALRPGGVAIVTTEQGASASGFALAASGRFVHHPEAAAIAFAGAGLVEIATRTVTLRREHGAAVTGTLTRARR